MCDFKPGDEVVCVNSRPITPGLTFSAPLVVGHIYTVASVGPTPVKNFLNGRVHVWVREVQNIDNLGDNIGFSPARFRKVERRTDQMNLEEWLKQPSGDTDRLDKSKKRERA